MAAEIRILDPDRFAEWRSVTRRGFGNVPTADSIARRRRLVELDRCFAALDGGRIVGTGSSHSFSMTVPGGGSVPAAGIASITTAATHTRRGIMTSMVRTLLQQARDRNESVAALCPSESSIYERFGFGPGTFAQELSVPTRHADLRPGAAEPLRASYVDAKTASRVMPAVWDRVKPIRPGWLDRSPEWWNYLYFDDGVASTNGPFFLIGGDEDDCDGYAIYETVRTGSHGEHQVRVRELVAVSDAVRRSLWRLILGIDLSVSIECSSTPLDDPLWWMLVDPRRLTRTTVDGVWIRLLDVASAMKARRYAADGRVTLQIVDGFEPASSGTFVLEASDGQAECRLATASPDIVLGPAELGSVYLGATPVRSLAGAGRVEESRSGAIELFDRMLSTATVPWCPHEF